MHDGLQTSTTPLVLGTKNLMIPPPLLKGLKISPICSANLDNKNGLSNIKAWS